MLEERFIISDRQWALMEPHCLGKKLEFDPRVCGVGRSCSRACIAAPSSRSTATAKAQKGDSKPGHRQIKGRNAASWALAGISYVCRCGTCLSGNLDVPRRRR